MFQSHLPAISGLDSYPSHPEHTFMQLVEIALPWVAFQIVSGTLVEQVSMVPGTGGRSSSSRQFKVIVDGDRGAHRQVPLRKK